MNCCQVARSEFSIATSTLRPPTLLTRISIGAPFAERASAKILAGRGFGNIRHEGPDFSTAFPHLVSGSRKRVGIARDKHDIGARLCGRERNRSAEPPASPRDKDAFAVQPKSVEHRHVADPSRFCRAFLQRMAPAREASKPRNWAL